jgi:hypothetical protein
MYAAQGWVDLLTVQIKLLRGQAEILTWRALVDELFGERLSPAEHRQRLIAIAIAVASSAEPVPRAKIHVLTDALAEAYTTKGPKTVTRDLNRLVNLGLIASGPRGYRAQILLVRGMRPFAALNGSGAAWIKGAA